MMQMLKPHLALGVGVAYIVSGNTIWIDDAKGATVMTIGCYDEAGKIGARALRDALDEILVGVPTPEDEANIGRSDEHPMEEAHD